jgi:DNA-binding NtrC family response regulator
MRIGGSEYIRTDARVIAATNESLRKLVEVGRIREDFYYRLNVVKIQLPPLRERREDIPLLANHLIEKHSHREGLTPPVLASDALEVLLRAPLPGNVRELENALERAIVMGNGREIRAEDLGTELLASECVTRVAADDDDLCLEAHVRALEAELIVLALKASGQNRTSAAKRLGITDRTLRYKVQKYNIQVPPHGRTEPVVEGDMR